MLDVVTARTKDEAGYWILDASHCECGARSRMLDVGSWMLDVVIARAEPEAGC